LLSVGDPIEPLAVGRSALKETHKPPISKSARVLPSTLGDHLHVQGNMGELTCPAYETNAKLHDDRAACVAFLNMIGYGLFGNSLDTVLPFYLTRAMVVVGMHGRGQAIGPVDRGSFGRQVGHCDQFGSTSAQRRAVTRLFPCHLRVFAGVKFMIAADSGMNNSTFLRVVCLMRTDYIPLMKNAM
jgi:hypothetical protein